MGVIATVNHKQRGNICRQLALKGGEINRPEFFGWFEGMKIFSLFVFRTTTEINPASVCVGKSINGSSHATDIFALAF